jgi:hypothetical protein
MQLVIDFYFLYICVYNSTCFERQALIIRSPSPYIQHPVCCVCVCLRHCLVRNLLIEIYEDARTRKHKKNVLFCCIFVTVEEVLVNAAAISELRPLTNNVC